MVVLSWLVMVLICIVPAVLMSIFSKASGKKSA